MKSEKTMAALMSGLLLALSLGAASARADAGHDHGEAPAAAGPSLPRFTAASETFELVGVLQGNEIVMYLDRYADNSPVRNAQIELELNGAKVPVKPHTEGEYHAALPEGMDGGNVSVAASITAGDDIDVLAADLDLGAGHAGAAAAAPAWKRHAPWAAALGALLLLALMAHRLRNRRMGDPA